MNPIRQADVDRLNARSPGLVEFIQVGDCSFSFSCTNVESFGCSARIEFRFAGQVYDCSDNNRTMAPLASLLGREIIKIERLSDEQLAVKLSGDAEIRMWADDPAHECIVITLEHNSDGIEMMIF